MVHLVEDFLWIKSKSSHLYAAAADDFHWLCDFCYNNSVAFHFGAFSSFICVFYMGNTIKLKTNVHTVTKKSPSDFMGSEKIRSQCTAIYNPNGIDKITRIRLYGHWCVFFSIPFHSFYYISFFYYHLKPLL